MRLQTLLIIFVAIALPVMIILQVFIGYQVDTAILRTDYDNKLLGATYDTMATFQLNTTNNMYSAVSDTLVRDIEASINIFTSKFGTTLGQTGVTKNTILNYVPALLFTLYDGYYIYTPVTQPDGTIEHMLKPYVYYTKEYTYGTDSKMVINYSLDNYVVVYNYKGNEFTSKAGYLELTTTSSSKNANGIYYNKSTGTIKYNGVVIPRKETITRLTYDTNTGTTKTETTTSTSAYDYYKEAYEFSKWYNDTINSAFAGTTNYNKLYISASNSALPDAKSSFNDEKEKVIEDIITNNLIQAMNMYRKKSSIDFSMPKLTPEDWDKILHNVCVVSFIQGLPVGTAKYNNYAIVPSTENKQYISEKNIFYIAQSSDGDGSYHRLECSHLQGSNIHGYNKTEFSKQTVLYDNGNVFKKTVNGRERTVYYYPHSEMACYYCVVNASDSKPNILSLSDPEKLAYYTALAREKNNLVKLSDYVNGSERQYKISDIVPGSGSEEEDTKGVYTIIYSDGEMVFNTTGNVDPSRETVFVSSDISETKFSEQNSIAWKNYQSEVKTVTFTEKISPQYTGYWFNNFKNLENINNIEYLDTQNVTYMTCMFNGCEKLNTLDLSGFDTSEVTNMSSMFCGCKSLSELDLSKFNTGNVTEMGGMFFNCINLSTLNLSGFDTSKATSMTVMFAGCNSLSELNLSSFNTSNVTNMSSMFFGCNSLSELDLSSFNTSNVTNMSSMFCGCKSLSELDLSSFNTNNVTNMYSMFAACTNIKKIYVGNKWSIDSVTDSNDMFISCSKIEGGAGTKYKSGNTDKSYAHVDGGASNPGYLTLK